MSQALDTLFEHAQRERDEAQVALMQAEDLARTLLAQAEQLRTYRGEYAGRNPTRDGRSAPIELLRCHVDFMRRLEQALAQQQAQADAAERRAVALRLSLLECETRVASVRKLIERRRQAQRSVDERHEQRRTDEASQQRAWRLRAEAASASS